MRTKFKSNQKYDDIIDNFILKFDSKPTYAHGKTIRKAVTQTLWSKIRSEVLSKEKNTCSFCGYHTDDSALLRNLHAHEVWEYDESNLVLRLVDIKIICVNCHSCEHIRRVGGLISNEDKEKLFEHMAKVNKCGVEVIKYYYERYFKKDIMPNIDLNKTEEELTKEIRWKLQSHKLNWKSYVYKDIPYYDEVIEQLKKKDLLYIKD